ncbi:hypothetical protein [Polynucleobacter sphagniphilus]|uniref:hypothetical protein n=1 Tax=Polynucleobacter sphagniphilus TaxID=1743169 RepID=UPI002475C184|nr:hypothetical protein [Polynucleobacter sphagniphilus]MDH6525560.1 hypothetical protein [Polynucleobacter sphagniphilus]
MSKVTLRSCFHRLRELGQAPSGQSGPRGRAYRSGFQRSLGAMGFLFIYFLLSYQSLEGGQASSDNLGIFVLLFFAVIAAALGAFFAPRIAAVIYLNSLAARRHQAGKSHPRPSSSQGKPRSSQTAKHSRHPSSPHSSSAKRSD